jgi:HlyD family secretion protein
MDIQKWIQIFKDSMIAKSVLGLVISVIFLILIFKTDPIPVDVQTVQRTTYQEIVSEEGRSRVKEKHSLLSPVNGILRRVEKHPGDVVKKGEVLAIIDWDVPRKLVSPINGSILTIQRETEGPIGMGVPLMEVGDLSQMEVVITVLSEQTKFMNPGDPVKLHGFGESSIVGKIKIVEPYAFTKVSSLGVEEQRVRVLVDFVPPEGLGDGFQLDCKIILFEKPNSIVISTGALFRDGEDWFVYKFMNSKATKTLVKIESKSEGLALVTSGLNEGEQIILFPPESIQEGTKVKANTK